MDNKIGTGVTLAGNATSGANTSDQLQITNHYTVECRGKDGKLKWLEEFSNIVPNGGLDDLLNKYLKGSAYTAVFYVGLTDSTPTVQATDTMASHGGWTELEAYSETVRQTLTLGAVSGQSVDNTASKAVFTVSQDSQSIGGAFITTDQVKGGTTGILYSVAAFQTGDKGLDTGDTLNVSVFCTAASA